MKAICFNCHFVGVGVVATRCPGCSYPLIMSADTTQLGTNDLEHAFEKSSHRSLTAPLPGVVFRVPRPFIKRPIRRRATSEGGGTSLHQEPAQPRLRRARLVGEVVAASAAFLFGLFITLGAFGAL